MVGQGDRARCAGPGVQAWHRGWGIAPLCRVKGAEQRLSKLGLASLRAAAAEHCVLHCLTVLCHPTGQGQCGTDQRGCVQGTGRENLGALVQ